MMRHAAICLGLVACGGGGGSADIDAAPDVPDAGSDALLRVVTPDVEIQPAEEITYCYYFDMPNTDEVGVKRWASTMTPGSHHLILFMAGPNAPAAGTMIPDCDGFALGDEWTYSAQTPTNSADMPAGVGMPVAAGQRAFLQMHYLNASDDVINAHVEVEAETYPAGTEYTRAAAYITYSQGFTVPASPDPYAVSAECSVPATAKFFGMSTHSHQYSIQTDVFDGDTNVVTSTNWEHPTVASWMDAPHYTFSTGRLRYECQYLNTSGAPVDEGSSAEFNEMCMAVGYFFPANNGSQLCVNGFVLP